MVNRLISKMLIFLIIGFKILGHVEKRNSFQKTGTIFKGIIFLYFQTTTCYNSTLVLSRLDPALVKAAYNITCPQLNGDTLISLYAHRCTGREGEEGCSPPQVLGNSDFLGSKRKFGQTQVLKTFPCFFIVILKR